MSDAARAKAIWSCKIGECERDDLPNGADSPLRLAVERAYRETTGRVPRFIFSGWNATLTESERAVVEDRLPDPRKTDAYTAERTAALQDDACGQLD